jgi:hypothetical protein
LPLQALVTPFRTNLAGISCVTATMAASATSPALSLAWPNHGNDRLPGRSEALRSPLKAFPRWYLRVRCERCDQERYVSQAQLIRKGLGDEPVRLFIGRLRHEGCGGRPKTVELVTDMPGLSREPVRRIGLVSRNPTA